MARRRLVWLGPGLVMAVVWTQPGFAQDQRAFPILKALEQQKLTEALQLIRASQRCVDEARNLHALHECHRQERWREWEQRERFRQQIDAVRARFGLRRPGGDRGAPPGPPPGPGGGW